MADATENQASAPAEPTARPHCGVIMPISTSEGYPAEHWIDIFRLVREAADDAGFSCDMVSGETNRNDVIHNAIVNNIYDNAVAVCDVSNRNPNVMLELGLRLASQKPVVIIFDGQGNYPFDLNTIRYIDYRKDMRYYATQVFKRRLTEKIAEVYKAYQEGKYQSFLSHFKTVNIELDTLSTESQSFKDFITKITGELADIKSQLSSSERIQSEISTYIDPNILYDYFSTKLRALNLYAPLTSTEIDNLGEMLKSRYRKELTNAPLSVLHTIVDTMVNPYLRSQGRMKP